jgi:hypothetical protein
MGLCLKIRPKIAQGWMKKKEYCRSDVFLKDTEYLAGEYALTKRRRIIRRL